MSDLPPPPDGCDSWLAYAICAQRPRYSAPVHVTLSGKTVFLSQQERDAIEKELRAELQVYKRLTDPKWLAAAIAAYELTEGTAKAEYVLRAARREEKQELCPLKPGKLSSTL